MHRELELLDKLPLKIIRACILQSSSCLYMNCEEIIQMKLVHAVNKKL